MLDIFLWIFAIYGLYRLWVDVLEMKDLMHNKSKIIIRLSEYDSSIINAVVHILQSEKDLMIRIEDIGLKNDNFKKLNELKSKYDNIEIVKL